MKGLEIGDVAGWFGAATGGATLAWTVYREWTSGRAAARSRLTLTMEWEDDWVLALRLRLRDRQTHTNYAVRLELQDGDGLEFATAYFVVKGRKGQATHAPIPGTVTGQTITLYLDDGPTADGNAICVVTGARPHKRFKLKIGVIDRALQRVVLRDKRAMIAPPAH